MNRLSPIIAEPDKICVKFLFLTKILTRLRVNIKDPAKLNEESINQLPNSGIVKKGTDIQIVYGLQVADIKRAVEAQLENQ